MPGAQDWAETKELLLMAQQAAQASAYECCFPLTPRAHGGNLMGTDGVCILWVCVAEEPRANDLALSSKSENKSVPLPQV